MSLKVFTGLRVSGLPVGFQPGFTSLEFRLLATPSFCARHGQVGVAEAKSGRDCRLQAGTSHDTRGYGVRNLSLEMETPKP